MTQVLLEAMESFQSNEDEKEKVSALARDRKKKQDRRFLTRKLLEDLEAILPSDGSSMRRTLHRVLEDCIEHVKSAQSSSSSAERNSDMPANLWKDGLMTSKYLGVGTLSSQFCFSECNEGMGALLGKEPSSIVGQDVFSLLHPEDGILVMHKLNRQKTSGLAVQETVRSLGGKSFEFLITKAASGLCVVACPLLPNPVEACGQKRARSEGLDLHHLETAITSALKNLPPVQAVQKPREQEQDKPKSEVPYHPYLHGLRGLGSTPSFNLFNTQPATSAPVMSNPAVPAFAPSLTQLPANSALAQYIQALSASQTANANASAAASSMGWAAAAVPCPEPAPASSALPGVNSLGLPMPFATKQEPEPAPVPVPPAVSPAVSAAGAMMGWRPKETSPPAGATLGGAEEGGAVHAEQLKLQEQVERQYRQLNDLTRQLSTMKELLSRHIPALAPADASATHHPPQPAPALPRETDAPAETSEDRANIKAGPASATSGSAGAAKKERAPRKMPSTRNATVRWTREEHTSFLKGLERLGTGQWASISKYYVPTRTPAQVASHHQKFAIRSNMPAAWRQKPSILDITTEPVQRLVASAPAPST
mmetsp:Transcript_48394/g.96910  ORF Transcript_48394/g.96910 Transcript_48394/m.96910 type:complete len:596 (-) Transcript_48394:33-1820(-)